MRGEREGAGIAGRSILRQRCAPGIGGATGGEQSHGGRPAYVAL